MTAPRFFTYTAIGLLTLLWLCFILSWTTIYKPEEIEYGVTFSKKQSQALGLDWKANYLAMLDELKVKKLRLPVYWDEVQPGAKHYDWSDTDWQIDEAEKRGVQLILTIGNRVPRWPECHLPGWTDDYSAAARQDATMEYLREAVARYRQRPTLAYWQVENEPFLKYFGICPPFDKDFLDKEIALVKSLDTHPIIVTDSGELSLWFPAAKRADVFGSTMYLNTYSSHLKRYIHYPITPAFFRIKRNLANLFAYPQDWIVIELQGEPWGKTSFQDLPQEERDRTMTIDKFNEIGEFARQSGFRTMYWWGVEFWYWEKQRGNDAYWLAAQKLFKQ